MHETLFSWKQKLICILIRDLNLAKCSWITREGMKLKVPCRRRKNEKDRKRYTLKLLVHMGILRAIVFKGKSLRLREISNVNLFVKSRSTSFYAILVPLTLFCWTHLEYLFRTKRTFVKHMTKFSKVRCFTWNVHLILINNNIASKWYFVAKYILLSCELCVAIFQTGLVCVEI